jgi:hypothetical protein
MNYGMFFHGNFASSIFIIHSNRLFEQFFWNAKSGEYAANHVTNVRVELAHRVYNRYVLINSLDADYKKLKTLVNACFKLELYIFSFFRMVFEFSSELLDI